MNACKQKLLGTITSIQIQVAMCSPFDVYRLDHSSFDVFFALLFRCNTCTLHFGGDINKTVIREHT